MRSARCLLAGKRPAMGVNRPYTVRAGRLELPQHPSLLEYVWQGLKTNSGGGTAVHCPTSGRKIGYDRLREASHNLSCWLADNCHGSLALLLPNSPESVVSALGALEAGVPLAGLNPESTTEELARALKHLRSPWIITKSSLVHNALEAVRVVEAETRQDYPIKVISVDEEVVFSGVIQLVDIIDSRPVAGSARQRREQAGAGTALLSHAWGEHGPETVLASPDGLLASCLQASATHLQPGDRLATNLPFFTRYGLSQGVLSGLSAGAELVILPQRGDLGSLLHQYQPAAAALIPASLGHVRSTPPPSLRSVTVPGLVARQVEQTLDPKLAERVIQHYGPPEGPVVFAETAARDTRRIGQPVVGTEVRVTAAGGEVGVMSEGEISVRGPQFGPSDSWVPTGDTGYYDPEGTFYLTRAGGLTVDGLGVWPGELEAVLERHEGVVAAAVVGAGGQLVAVVVPSDPYRPPTDLRLWMAEKTSPHKQLTKILFTSSLPLTEDGLVDKQLIISRFVQPMEYVAVSSI